MQKVVLPNGLTVLYQHKPGRVCVVEVMIKVGSNWETKDEKGISHLLEHMLFEGTPKRPDNRAIANEIESIGGEFNAYTSNERTCFYVKVLNKHFKKALDVLSDIVHNPLMREADIVKEKKVVLREIAMVYDEPRLLQWVILQEKLFKNHPAKYPVYGDQKVIENLTKEDLLAYMQKYYVPSNLVVSIVGDVSSWKELVKSHFNERPFAKSITRKKITEPPLKKSITKRKKLSHGNTYLAFGFRAVPRDHKDSYALEVIDAILGRGQSGKLFTEVRGKRGLAYDVGSEYVHDASYGYFAAYACINRKDLAAVKKLLLAEFSALKNISPEEVKEAKQYIEGDHYLELEDAQKIADQMLFWELVGDVKLMKDYIKHIKEVNVLDVRRVAKKYLSHYVSVVLEGK